MASHGRAVPWPHHIIIVVFTISALLSIFWGKKANIAWLDFGCKIPRANHYYSENSSYDEHPRVIFKPHQKGEFYPQIKVDSFIPVVFKVTVLCQHKSEMEGCSSH